MDTVKETIMQNMAVCAGLMIALVLCLIYFFWWGKKEGAKSGKKGQTPDESEMDELIEKIHSKQKKSATTAKK